MKALLIAVFLTCVACCTSEAQVGVSGEFVLGSAFNTKDGEFGKLGNGLTSGLGISLSLSENIEATVRISYVQFQGVLDHSEFYAMPLDDALANSLNQLWSGKSHAYETSIGFRFYGQGTQLFRPFFSLRTGGYFLKATKREFVPQLIPGDIAQSENAEYSVSLNRAFIMSGVGLQIPIADTFALNIDGGLQILSRESSGQRNSVFFPVAASVQYEF